MNSVSPLTYVYAYNRLDILSQDGGAHLQGTPSKIALVAS